MSRQREFGEACAYRRRGRGSRPRGFTLIELLVVLAIVAVLMSFLAPTILGVRTVVGRLNCALNEKQLIFAWAGYALEKKVLVNSNTSGAICWQRSGDFGNSRDAITQGALWPYTQDVDLYRCQTSIYPYIVSYSINGLLYGEWSVVTKLQSLPDMAKMLVFVEEYDNRGYNINSFLIDPANYNWVDVMAGNHQGGDNLGFADGHVEYWRWLDPRTLAFSGGHNCSAPGSVDLQRLAGVYYPW